MFNPIGLDKVEPDKTKRRDLWRLLTPETVGEIGATAGVADYHPPTNSAAGETPSLGGAHARPEIYFVLGGAGELHTPDRVVSLRTGEAFMIPGGVPHTIVGKDGQSLRAFYVSLKGPA